MNKTLIVALAIVAVLIPTTTFAWDQFDDRLQIKTDLELRELALKDELKKEDNSTKQEQLQRKIDNVKNFTKAIELDYMMHQAFKDGDISKQQELLEQFKEINAKHLELSGNRVYIANLTGIEKDVEHENKLAERQAKLDDGYKLYPGVGWVKNDNTNPIYTTHPETGEKIMDLDAMIKYRGIELDGEIWPDTTGWNIAGSKHEPTQTLSYITDYWKVSTDPVNITREKTVSKVEEKIKEIDNKENKTFKDQKDLEKLKLAKQWLEARANNDTEKMHELSEKLTADFSLELGGGVMCDPDVSHSECLKNAPTITFDFPPFIYHPFFFIIIAIVTIIIIISVVIYFKNKTHNS